MQANRVCLDRDAALALEIHRVEHLRFHLTGLKGPGELEEPIGEGRLSVIDMRDNGEIPDELLVQDAFIMTDAVAGAGQDGPHGAATVCLEPDGPCGARWPVWSEMVRRLRMLRVEPGLQSRRSPYLSSIRTHGCGTLGPVYSARGRISRLFDNCSSTWAVHPAQRLTAKIGVKSAIGTPSA
jgi:hypothetical protein